MSRVLCPPLTEEVIAELRVGEQVLFSGRLLTARDAAHRLLVATLEAGEELPVDLRGQVIYYTGPTPAPPGKVIGAVGPTTSSRMDPYTIPLLAAGLKGMIGKGHRSPEVREALQRFRAVYFVTYGGAGALLSRCVRKVELLAYPELGPEAIYALWVEDFPAWVANDIYGADLYTDSCHNCRG
ncbi:FumA C-terminus/TtdB family hydratase beta subunit [Desulfothermobacter acidiphilus]|uniref:FumA C-terminus/TtdB family hydratase beta subunit n=1 Tax=Desulfothermobacter acidiphilus TaxID=1938353 RepID=UPI003F8B331E